MQTRSLSEVLQGFLAISFEELALTMSVFEKEKKNITNPDLFHEDNNFLKKQLPPNVVQLIQQAGIMANHGRLENSMPVDLKSISGKVSGKLLFISEILDSHKLSTQADALTTINKAIKKERLERSINFEENEREKGKEKYINSNPIYKKLINDREKIPTNTKDSSQLESNEEQSLPFEFWMREIDSTADNRINKIKTDDNHKEDIEIKKITSIIKLISLCEDYENRLAISVDLNYGAHSNNDKDCQELIKILARNESLKKIHEDYPFTGYLLAEITYLMLQTSRAERDELENTENLPKVTKTALKVLKEFKDDNEQLFRPICNLPETTKLGLYKLRELYHLKQTLTSSHDVQQALDNFSQKFNDGATSKNTEKKQSLRDLLSSSRDSIDVTLGKMLASILLFVSVIGIVVLPKIWRVQGQKFVGQSDKILSENKSPSPSN